MLGARIVLVSLTGTEDGIPDLTEDLQLPVLQDNAEAGVAGCFGASKWYIYIVDKAGIPRVVHYQLDLDSERNRLFEELAALEPGGAK